MNKERAHPSEASMGSPWPLDAWPDVPTKFVLCGEDRFFPPGFLRRVVAERLDITPDEIASGHCVALSRPRETGGRTGGLRGRTRWLGRPRHRTVNATSVSVWFPPFSIANTSVLYPPGCRNSAGMGSRVASAGSITSSTRTGFP
ncbi:MAG: alpha/beta hydrolase, partial [Pseudonocardiaceae bacterium]